MNKQKKIFSAVFAVLLIVMTSFVLILYDNVKEHTQIRKNYTGTGLDGTLQLFTLAKAREVNPSFEVITFDKSVPQDVKEAITKDVEDAMREAVYLLENDPNFVYSIKDTLSHAEISRNLKLINKKDNKENYNLYVALKYNYNGELQTADSPSSLYYDSFDFRELMSGYMNIDSTYTVTGEVDNYYIYDYTIKPSQFTINVPKYLNVTYIVPNKMVMSGYVYSYINTAEAYTSFTCIALLMGSAIIALFILFYPIRIVENTQPFASEKKWKSAVQITILSTAITFLVIGVIILTGYTLNGFMLNVLQRYEIKWANFLVMSLNFVIWLFTYYVIAIAAFQIKYIFAHGFLRYLKEDTLTGSLLRYIKRKVNALMEIDLSGNLQKHLLKLVLIHMFIIMVITTTWAFGYLLSILYACLLFCWLKKKLDKIQQDYSKIQSAMHELGQGNFELELHEDVGMFHGLKDEFGNIRTSFENAVKEETKSQNMKTELISNVSHDLKTPLTCIKNYIVLLQDETLDEKTRQEYLNNLNQYSNRLTTLIEDLFDVSKVNSGNIKLDLMNINIVALLEQAHAECTDLLEEKGLKVVSTYPRNEIPLYLDGGKTYRIFENLFTNIAKYAMPNSRVYIDVTETEKDICIIFKNISNVQMNFTADEIVDRFVRGDKSRHEGGSGLGLAIVKSFAEVQGGHFHIDIDGDLFKATITFPKRQQEDQETHS